MRKLDLRDTILAYLRAAGAPVTSRHLASRFLLIRHDDEATCHRLLAPILAGHRSLEYAEGSGWSYRRSGSSAPAAATGAGEGAVSIAPRPAPEVDGADMPLHDFVALAAEGAGPSGSGTIRVVSLQPVVAGEECSPEHLPAWVAEEGAPAADSATPPRSARGPGAQPVGLGADELRILVETVGELPIVCHRVAREAGPLLRACAALSLPFHPITISLAKLGHLLLGLKARHAPSELAAALGLDMREPDDCRGRVRLMTQCFLALLPMLEEIGIGTFEELQTYQNEPAAPIDFSPYAFSADDLKAVPARPGVYRFYDRQGEILYVGKAKSLRTRLASYFVPSARNTERGRAVLERAHSFAFEIAASELEALLNEAALLSELRPPLNRQFDVHDRPAPYGPRLNLVIVLPEGAASAAAPPAACTVHLLRQGRYRRRIRGLPSPQDAPSPRSTPSPADAPGAPRSRWSILDDAVRAVYFESSADDLPGGTEAAGREEAPPPAAAVDSEGVAGPEPSASDVDWRLVASYLARHRDEVNVLDVDECDSLETALARLRVLAAATVGGERVIAR